jgi:NADPH:quinone reductase-like Zn-dependent oxidoreductase
MKAAVFTEYGGPEKLSFRDMPTPTPKPGEVLIKVAAASINDWDWGVLNGEPFVNRMLNGWSKPKLQVLGCDVAGTVEAVGADVSVWRAGDAVFGDLCESGFGTFAEYVCAPAGSLARKPENMSFVDAAALPQAGALAVQALEVQTLKPGQRILLNCAGGGVGTIALQLLKPQDVEVTVVDKASKFEMLRALGAQYYVDYEREDFTKRGERYDFVVDVKTNRSPWAYARALERGGAYATVGGTIPRLLDALVWGPAVEATQGRRVKIVALKANRDLALLAERYEAGALRPVIDGPYPFAYIAAALRRFGAGDHKGKIVLTMT